MRVVVIYIICLYSLTACLKPTCPEIAYVGISNGTISKSDIFKQLVFIDSSIAIEYKEVLSKDYEGLKALECFSKEELWAMFRQNQKNEKLFGEIDIAFLPTIKNPSIISNAQAVCAMFDVSQGNIVQLDDGSCMIINHPIDPPLCDTSPFKGYSRQAAGTAFAINDSVVLTTAHYTNMLTNMIFIFDYVELASDNDTVLIPSRRVFRFDSLMASDTDVDFMLLKVNKKIPSAWQVKKVNVNYEYGDNVPIYMLGHPMGWPLMLTDNASIMGLTPSVILSDLDKLEKNSGSPVFCASSHALIGPTPKETSSDRLLEEVNFQ
jgi:hypothetical protein